MAGKNSQTAAPRLTSTLSAKKTRDIEQKTGRTVVSAVALSADTVEFVTPQHEHFLYDRKRETFSRVSDDQTRHCSLMCQEI